VIVTDSGSGPCDVINDVIEFSVSNDHISATDRPIDFGFSGMAGMTDRVDLPLVASNPRWRPLMTS